MDLIFIKLSPVCIACELLALDNIEFDLED